MKDLKLGMQMGYWGAGPDPRMVSVASLGLGRLHAAFVDWGAHQSNPAGHGGCAVVSADANRHRYGGVNA